MITDPAKSAANQVNDALSTGPGDTSLTKFNAIKTGLTERVFVNDSVNAVDRQHGHRAVSKVGAEKLISPFGLLAKSINVSHAEAGR